MTEMLLQETMTVFGLMAIEIFLACALIRTMEVFMLLKMVNNTSDAEDLTIEAFGKAFKNLQQYTPSYAFNTWLFKIATNNCIDFIRKKRLAVMSMDQGFSNADGESVRIDAKAAVNNPEESMMHDQKVIHMRLLVSKLKPRYRLLVEKGEENPIIITATWTPSLVVL